VGGASASKFKRERMGEAVGSISFSKTSARKDCKILQGRAYTGRQDTNDALNREKGLTRGEVLHKNLGGIWGRKEKKLIIRETEKKKNTKEQGFD